MGEATFNEQEMAHSHNQDWSEENWVPMQWDQGKIQQYGDEGEDPPYRESTPSQWSHTQLTSPQPQFKHHQPCPENLQHAAWQSAMMVAIQEDHLNPPEWLLFTPNDTVFARELEEGEGLSTQGFENRWENSLNREPTPPYEHPYPTLNPPPAEFTHPTQVLCSQQSPLIPNSYLLESMIDPPQSEHPMARTYTSCQPATQTTHLGYQNPPRHPTSMSVRSTFGHCH